jgi:hypothetical protein
MKNTTKKETTIVIEGKADISDNYFIRGSSEDTDLEEILGPSLKDFDKKNIRLTLTVLVEEIPLNL